MILVTGATGFLGSEVARQLVQQGKNIRCTKRITSVIPVILLPFKAKSNGLKPICWTSSRLKMHWKV